MTPPKFIRVSVFRMSQDEFASAIGSTQPSVARWEAQGRIPAEHQDIVRALGKDICAGRGEAWSDSWFFEVPDGEGAP
jgi:hypothetical protein